MRRRSSVVVLVFVVTLAPLVYPVGATSTRDHPNRHCDSPAHDAGDCLQRDSVSVLYLDEDRDEEDEDEDRDESDEDDDRDEEDEDEDRDDDDGDEDEYREDEDEDQKNRDKSQENEGKHVGDRDENGDDEDEEAEGRDADEDDEDGEGDLDGVENFEAPATARSDTPTTTATATTTEPSPSTAPPSSTPTTTRTPSATPRKTATPTRTPSPTPTPTSAPASSPSRTPTTTPTSPESPATMETGSVADGGGGSGGGAGSGGGGSSFGNIAGPIPETPRLTEEATVTSTSGRTATPPPPTLELRSAVLDERLVQQGEPFRVTARVQNVGGREGTFEPALAVDGQVQATRRVSLGPNESATIVFEHRPVGDGAHAVTVASVPVGNVTVLRSVSVSRSRVRVVEARLLADWVRRGYDASVVATVANPGNETAVANLTATVGGDAVASRTVELSPGATRQVRIAFPARPGPVAVGGVDAGHLRVGTAPEAAEPPATRASGPGFDAGLALLALAALVGVITLGSARKRRD